MRGELWFTNAKKIRRDLKRKKIFHRGKAFERSIRITMSSPEIFDIIKDELERLKSEPPIKGRYMDIDVFSNVGQYVDWRQFCNLKTLS